MSRDREALIDIVEAIKLILRYIAILNDLQTRYILFQLRKIKFLVMSKELKQPLDSREGFTQMPKLS